MRLVMCSVCIAVALAAAATDNLGKELANSEPVRLDTPPFKYYCSAPSRARIDTVKLTPVSSTPNSITDEEDWFARNDLALPEYEVPNAFRGRSGNVPAGIPSEYRGDILVCAIRRPQATLLVYGKDFSEGRYLVALDSSQAHVRYVWDFDNYVHSPGDVEADREFIAQALVWAEERDSILYVCHSHRTYASSSGGLNGYVTALNLRTGAVAWRSRSLVCNSRNFEIIGDCIISGYGFTDEPDYLYILNRYTGAVIRRQLLKTAPDYIIRKGDQLFVRCYDTDYVFRIR